MFLQFTQYNKLKKKLCSGYLFFFFFFTFGRRTYYKLKLLCTQIHVEIIYLLVLVLKFHCPFGIPRVLIFAQSHAMVGPALTLFSTIFIAGAKIDKIK